jgi:hypothetical protein
VLVDAGYHSLKNLEAVTELGAVPIIAVNPGRKGKVGKVSNAVFFGGRRWSVEQLNGHCKATCYVAVGLGRGVCLGSRRWCWRG